MKNILIALLLLITLSCQKEDLCWKCYFYSYDIKSKILLESDSTYCDKPIYAKQGTWLQVDTITLKDGIRIDSIIRTVSCNEINRLGY